jgi:hypothetical protein
MCPDLSFAAPSALHSPSPPELAMNRSIACALLLPLAGCASSGPMTESVGIANAAIQTGTTGASTTQDVQITSRPGLGSVTLDATVDRVWGVLPSVYLELGIPLSQTDNAQKLLVAQNQRVSRIGGKRLSTYFRCGGTYGDNADGGNAYVTARTQVLAAADGKTMARTEVRAAASGDGTTVGECGSTGLLERAIGEAIQAKIAAGGAAAP